MPHAKPRPVALPAALKADVAVDEIRNLYCSYYAGCIDVAVKKGWESFTCTKCHYFKKKDGEQPHVRDFAFNQPSEPGVIY